MLIQVHVPKANHTFEFDTTLLPSNSVEYATAYGFRQTIVDTTAGIKRSDFATDAEFNAAALAKAIKRVEQLESGNVPGSRSPVDPNAAKARKLAKELSDSELDAALEFIMKARAKAAKSAAA